MPGTGTLGILSSGAVHERGSRKTEVVRFAPDSRKTIKRAIILSIKCKQKAKGHEAVQRKATLTIMVSGNTGILHVITKKYSDEI